MPKSSLGRVLDPSALDAATGPRARLRITVPAAWLVEGADLAITVPARLSCARCDGGGCDACDRSGALRAPGDAAVRVIHASVPRASSGLAPEPPAGIVLRISHPFGPVSGIEQLLLEVRASAAPSVGVTRRAPSVPIAGGAHRVWPVIAAVAAAILFAIFGR